MTTVEPAATGALSPANRCTVSITCCIGERVGLGMSCVSTETDLTIGAKSGAGGAFLLAPDGTLATPSSRGAARPSDGPVAADNIGAPAATVVDAPPAATRGSIAALSLEGFVEASAVAGLDALCG